jgi:hypothetical protein
MQLMTEPGRPIYFDLDPVTSETEPTTYEAVRTALLSHHPGPEDLPDDVSSAAELVVISHDLSHTALFTFLVWKERYSSRPST